MIQITSATYEDGVFRPDELLPLAPKSRVRLVIEPLPSAAHSMTEKWAEIKDLWRRTSIDSAGEKLTREQLHERR